MVVMVVCGLLLVIGVACVVAWGPADVRPPPADDGFARRYLWHVTVAVAAGVGAGVLVAGAGGRLVMRLLASTAGNEAQGRETEAEEIVGRISTGGTVSFIFFTALFFGIASGVVYLLIRRWLPAGRLGGLTFGALLLVLAATRLEPLRSDNADFDLVGPGWLAATAFGLLVVLHGMLVAALAGRYSQTLPLLARDRRSLLGHAPLLALLPMAPALVVVAVVGGLVAALRRLEPLVNAVRSPKALVGGRVILAILAVGALPACVATFADIAGRQT